MDFSWWVASFVTALAAGLVAGAFANPGQVVKNILWVRWAVRWVYATLVFEWRVRGIKRTIVQVLKGSPTVMFSYSHCCDVVDAHQGRPQNGHRLICRLTQGALDRLLKGGKIMRIAPRHPGGIHASSMDWCYQIRRPELTPEEQKTAMFQHK